jgi:hypothetical protein
MIMAKYTPHFCRDGNKVLFNAVVIEQDRTGNWYQVTRVTYEDKKGKRHEDVRLVKHLGTNNNRQ